MKTAKAQNSRGLIVFRKLVVNIKNMLVENHDSTRLVETLLVKKTIP